MPDQSIPIHPRVANVVQTIIASILASAVAWMGSNIYKYGDRLNQLNERLFINEYHVQRLVKFEEGSIGNRFTITDWESAENAIIERFERVERNCRNTTASMQDHHSKAQRGWAIIEALQKDQHRHDWTRP